MPKRIELCDGCGKPLGQVRLTVHVADAFAHEAPAGKFCLVGKCYERAVAANFPVDYARRLHADAEVVCGE